MQVNKLFVVAKEDVKYPTFCPQGIVLKEMDGSRVYPVDEFLGDILKSKIGQLVEEDIDFEVIEREISSRQNRRQAMLCDKGEIAGGGVREGRWYYSMIGDEEMEYPAESLIPVQHAQPLETFDKRQNAKWRQIEHEFDMVSARLLTTAEIVGWFRRQVNEKKA
jgi:hypothetical protein